jgi:tetratricopeptide (TPR) repeat protein
MVAIHPQPETAKIAQALGKSPDAIVRESKGFVASFIGLAFLQHADPVRALEWAKISGELVSSPLPLYVGEVSRLYWQSRAKKVKTRLPFQDQFRELAGVEDYFDEPENVFFLEKAGLKLDTDLNDAVLPYFVLEALESTLVSKDAADQDLLIRLGHGRIALDPSDKSVWMSLGTVCEHASNRTCVISALEGLIAADPLNSEAKLHLAYELVLSGEYGKAESVLAVIDREKVRYDADYPFCRGAIAEWKNNPDDALNEYKKAIDMRRYKPAYHLHHGRLLMASGRKEEAIKALRWAVEIDASGNVRKQAEELLSEIKN